jgi:hypothetical protein
VDGLHRLLAFRQINDDGNLDFAGGNSAGENPVSAGGLPACIVLA